MQHTYFSQKKPSGNHLLLLDYRPLEFGNTKIDLTIDGGQHLRSPDDDEPP